MSYQPHNWVSNEIIKAAQLNHIEEGIFDEYTRAVARESSIAESVESEITRATNAESSISGVVLQNQTSINTLNADSSTPGSVEYKIAHSAVGSVSGVKGDNESTYRTGNVNLTKDDIGLGNVENYKAVSVEQSQGLTDTEKTNARANIGLNNVGNFLAVSTVANQGLTETQKANARANIGAGASGFSGDYNDLTNKPFIPSKTSDLTNDSGFTTNTGTVTSVSSGVGLSGSVSVSGEIKANLKSETRSSLTATSRGATANREYPVGVDSNGNLSVNVPWSESFKKGTTAGGATADTLIFVYSGD